MTDSGENTHLNLGKSPEGGDPADIGSGEYYKIAVRGGYGGTEAEFDYLVEKDYHGAYPTAIQDLGYVEKPTVISPVEAFGYEDEVAPTDDYVDVRERAQHLPLALGEFLEYSRAEGLDKAMHTSSKNVIRKRMGDVIINKTLKGMSGHLRKGNHEFHIAFGPTDDPRDEEYQAMGFREMYTGTGKVMDKDKFTASLYNPKK